MTIRTPSQIGRANRRKGADAERDLARYLRQWWPDAERKVVSGWRAGDRESADRGDIRGTPKITWQVKNTAVELQGVALAKVMDEAGAQATGAGSDYAIVVQRRPRKPDPGDWWAWITVADLVALVTDWITIAPRDLVPIRIELRHLIPLLLRRGYGRKTA